jgi:hypothetical protein
MDPANASIAVAVDLPFRRARAGRRFGETSGAVQKEQRK